MPDTALYCPGLDDEMQGQIDSMVAYRWVDKEHVSVGGGRSLGELDPSWKLYILCHGHALLPMFSTTVGMWSAKDLALMMMTDGLNTAHRNIELLAACRTYGHVTTEVES